MTKVKIESITEKVSSCNPSAIFAGSSFIYVDINSVDRELKLITEPQTLLAENAPSRARQILKTGDIIVSTVRPNLNAVAYVPESLNGAIGSTGFCVLRRNAAKLYDRYLYHWVKHPKFVLEMTRLATGASYPAVSDKIIKESLIPLPSLPEQKRIAAILDKADEIRRKRERAIELTDSFLRAVFLEMFGDPILNEKNWEMKELGTLIGMIGGYAFKSSDYVEEGIPLVKIGNANRSDFDVRNLSFLPCSFMESHQRFLLSPGDMVMSLTGTTGKDDYGNINIVPESYSRWFLNQRVAKITIKKELSRFYLLGLLRNRRFKANLISVSRGVRQANLRNEDLLLQRVPCPPQELQQKYDRIVELSTNLRSKMQKAQKSSCNLTQSLAMRIFDLNAKERIEKFAEEAYAL